MSKSRQSSGSAWSCNVNILRGSSFTGWLTDCFPEDCTARPVIVNSWHPCYIEVYDVRSVYPSYGTGPLPLRSAIAKMTQRQVKLITDYIPILTPIPTQTLAMVDLCLRRVVTLLICLRPHRVKALSDAFVWRLTSVAYIGPNSRTERPRKTKISTKVAAHVTRDSDTSFKVKRSKVVADALNSQHAGTGATWRINTKILSTCRGRM